MCKDALGQPLEIGSRVIFMRIGYRQFMTGIIDTMAPKSALIRHTDRKGTPLEKDYEQSRQFFDQIILDTRFSNTNQ